MQLRRTFDQHIAVFGESGSGKTVLVSSFYGAAQEPQYLKENLFNIVADYQGQGSRLHQNYLGMKNSAQAPGDTKFSATPYSFSVKLKDEGNAKASKKKPFDALRLVWHDYPGQWFEQDVSGPEESQRRVDTFRALLSSDVALILVDGQRLLDNAGEEERYLKSLFGNFRNGLLSLTDELLEDGKPLARFPRIWILGLSKSDLLPELDVFNFRDLLVEKATGDISQLRDVIARFVENDDALAVGEDFLLLSSAKFEPGKIETTERVGLELLLPLASMLPFERHVRWSESKLIPGKIGEYLLGNAGALAAALVGHKGKVPGPIGQALKLIDPDIVKYAGKLAGDKLKAMNADARDKNDNLRATLTRFKMDLDRGEEELIFLRSLR